MKSFAALFKKYRLRAEFETFSAFGNALSEKGYYYDESIYSHWQKGTRIPSNRHLILKILEIFIEREAIRTIEQANEFLSSAGLGYLTEQEKARLPLNESPSVPFQVPSEIAHFTGRDEIVKKIEKEITNGKVFLLYGPPGVGKTALAIKLGHLLKNKFPDGVLWYRMDTSNIKDILISIGHMLRQDLPRSNDIEIIASFIRSILAQKRILLIFDNVKITSDIHLLLPNSSLSSLIVISRQKNLYLPATITSIVLESFKRAEALKLFENVFGKNYQKRNKNTLTQLNDIVGNLPLAVHIIASQLNQSSLSPQELLKQLEHEEISLKNLSYENKNLYLTLYVSYKNLSQNAQSVFLSLGIFEGKDFSIDAIAYMNGITIEKSREFLDELFNASLIETSINNKFRIHPLIKKFISEQLNNPYLSLLMKITFLLFSFFTILWIILPWKTNSIFATTYFIVPLWGALWGFSLSKKWRGIKSIMGKTLFVFSLGLFFQVIGQVAYAWYSQVLYIDIPYPSLGDVGYVGSMGFYLYGVILLAKVTGIKLNFNLIRNHPIISFIYSIVVVIGCIWLLQGYIFQWSNPIKVLLDFLYPIGGVSYSYLAILIYIELKRTNKKLMKNKIILFVIALFIQFLADLVFIYQANQELWKGGEVNDYMYLFAYLFMTLAILKLNAHLFKVVIK